MYFIYIFFSFYHVIIPVFKKQKQSPLIRYVYKPMMIMKNTLVYYFFFVELYSYFLKRKTYIIETFFLLSLLYNI